MKSNLRPIADVAADLGLTSESLELYGRDQAKIPLDSFPKRSEPGRLVVVTAITPTPAGEGKSTTAVGLTQGLAKIGKSVALTIRQPSLGPVFGHKGGGTGGGRSTVQPAEEINLHFTGDFHAMESAHNLLAAMTDNAVYRGAISGLEASGVTWRRVTDAEDRGLRQDTELRQCKASSVVSVCVCMLYLPSTISAQSVSSHPQKKKTLKPSALGLGLASSPGPSP